MKRIAQSYSHQIVNNFESQQSMNQDAKINGMRKIQFPCQLGKTIMAGISN
jgi:hypothetical protein